RAHDESGPEKQRYSSSPRSTCPRKSGRAGGRVAKDAVSVSGRPDVVRLSVRLRGAAPAARQQRDEFLRGQRLAVQVSLRLITPELPQGIELLLGLHSLGDDHEIEGARDRNDDRHQALAACV